MSTDPRSLKPQSLRIAHLTGLATGLAGIITLYLFIEPRNPLVANGALIGGLVALFGAAIAIWRSNKPSATSVERGISGLADERDSAVSRAAFAFAGKVSFLWIGGGVIAIGVGAPPEVASAVMIWGQLLSLIGALLFYSRKL